MYWLNGHILWKFLTHIGWADACCCRANCEDVFEGPSPGDGCDHSGDIGEVGCIAMPAVSGICAIDDFKIFLDANSLDVTLPEGWGKSCSDPAQECSDEMDEEVLVASCSDAAFALGNLAWQYPASPSLSERWCDNLRCDRRLTVRILCINVAAEEDPEDFRCHIQVEYLMFIVGGAANTYIWRKELINKLVIQNIDTPLEIPFYSRVEEIEAWEGCCELTGEPPITVQSHV